MLSFCYSALPISRKVVLGNLFQRVNFQVFQITHDCVDWIILILEFIILLVPLSDVIFLFALVLRCLAGEQGFHFNLHLAVSAAA